MTRADSDTVRNASRSDREGAQVWIRGALDLMLRSGVTAVKVERLARETGVSKGSFYWFFSDIDDLLMRSLEYWKLHLNDVVYEDVRTLDGPVEERMHRLIDTVFFGKLGRYDAAIRAWALTDPKVQAIVSAVDRERLDFLVEVFSEPGLTTRAARDRAHLFYRAFIAESYLDSYPAFAKRGAYLKELVSAFLTPVDDANVPGHSALPVV